LKYLLDTNLVSQLIKAKAEPGVLEWFDEQDEGGLFLSAVTILELRTGIELMPAGKKRTVLEHWLTRDIRSRFAGRILPIEEKIADACGRLLVRSQRAGWRMEAMDALIGATAMAHDMTLATLNRRHFERLDLEMVEF